MNFLRKVLSIAYKDVLAETRTKETISAVLVFTLLVVVIFNFAFGTGQMVVGLVAPGMLWVTFAFAGVLSLNRAFVMEKENGCLEGLMTLPISREVIFAGKALASLLFMLVVEAVSLPFFALFFNLKVFTIELVTVILLATIGFVAVGALFSALAVNTRAREIALPILFFPIVMPVIISAVKASEAALSGTSWGEMGAWLSILAAFDVIFLVVSYLVFPYVIEE